MNATVSTQIYDVDVPIAIQNVVCAMLYEHSLKKHPTFAQIV